MMEREQIDSWLEMAARAHGTPSFVYFAETVAERARSLRAALDERLALSFAVKSNPNPALIDWLRGEVDHLDVSSIGEFRLAVAAGWHPSLIGFTGPAKTEGDLREAITAGLGLLIIESVREAKLADGIAKSLRRTQSILVRVAPNQVPKGFGDHMAGRPCPFGIDEDDLDSAIAHIRNLSGLQLRGFHIYAGTQCLQPAVIAETYKTYLSLFRDLSERHDLFPDVLVLGSGLGIPYHEQDVPIDVELVARDTIEQVDALQRDPRFRRTRLMLELGRYLVGEAGYFVTRVVSIKESRGRRFVVCDGGMNNHLPASGHFGMVIRRNYRMHRVGERGGSEIVDVVGPLCTSIDRLASGIDLPHLDEGDLIAVHNSGAYGLTASPIHFISHRPPAELMVQGGALRNVTRFFQDAPALSTRSLAPRPAIITA